jgi:hypothetical protein
LVASTNAGRCGESSGAPASRISRATSAAKKRLYGGAATYHTHASRFNSGLAGMNKRPAGYPSGGVPPAVERPPLLTYFNRAPLNAQSATTQYRSGSLRFKTGPWNSMGSDDF